MFQKKHKRMMTYSILLASMLVSGVAIGILSSNSTSIVHEISLFSPSLALLVNGVLDGGVTQLFITGSAVPPAGSNIATDTLEWDSFQITGAHELILVGTISAGGITLADLVVTCDSIVLTGVLDSGTTFATYTHSIDATISDSATCTFQYLGSGASTFTWIHSIVDA